MSDELHNSATSRVSASEAFLRSHPELLDEDRTSPETLRSVAEWASPLETYFRFKMTGWENLLPGPCLIVANHSIGSPFVLLLLARAWQNNVPDREVRGMMHRIAWQWPWGRIGLLQRMGGVYAHPQVARRVLNQGRALLVFPGGDLDAMRPFADRYRVRFGGRVGFARLARELGVPVVPLAICGSHAAYFMLPGGEKIARFAGLEKRTGMKSFPLTLGGIGVAITSLFPLLWPLTPMSLVLAAVPMPTRIEARLLPAMNLGEYATDADAAEQVRSKLEAFLQSASTYRKTFLG